MARERPAHMLDVPRWTILVHAVQGFLAVIVLALAAFGIRWIPYNALIFSLVVCLCTFGVCAYMIASQLFLYTFFNMFLALALNIWMILFWIVDMGLTATLARIWSSPSYAYLYSYGYSYYDYSYKRDLYSLSKREEAPTIGAYYGTLAAGAFFCAAQVALWALSTVMLIIYVNKHRSGNANHTHVQPSQGPPPQYANNGQAVPLEKYNQTAPPQPTYQQSQQSYSASPTPQTQHAQPVPQSQGQYVQPPQPTYSQYPQDPVNRENTVSPVSQAGYAPPHRNTSELGGQQQTLNYHPSVSELSSPQHTGNYNPNVSELSSPQHTGQYNHNVPELASQK